MANNDDLILRDKALKDLRGIKDVLQAQGDPILASILNRAIECIENQPAAPALIMEPCRPKPEETNPDLRKVVKQLCAEYEKAKNNQIVHNPVGYALYQTWKKYE